MPDASIDFSVINIKEDNAWQRRVEMIIILTYSVDECIKEDILADFFEKNRAF